MLTLFGCVLLFFVDGPVPIALIAIGWLLAVVMTLRARDWGYLVCRVGGLGLILVGTVMRIRHDNWGESIYFMLPGFALSFVPDDLVRRWPFKRRADAGEAQRRRPAN